MKEVGTEVGKEGKSLQNFIVYFNLVGKEVGKEVGKGRKGKVFKILLVYFNLVKDKATKSLSTSFCMPSNF